MISKFAGNARGWLSLAALLVSAAGIASAIDYQLYSSSFPHEQFDSQGTNSALSGGPTDPAALQSVSTRAYEDGFAFLTRDPSELYLIGGLVPPNPNYIVKLDPLTLAEVKRTSLDCPHSDCPYDHVWAPTGAVHANGYLYVAAESRLWKLDNNLNVLGYVNLPITDGFYNSLKILSDGNIVVKGMGLDGGDQDWASLTIVTPNLDVVVPDFILPEKAVARITDLVHNGHEQIYITGATTVIRYDYTPGGNPVLTQDPTWSYHYREATDTDTSPGGLPTFIGDEAYFVDNALPPPPTGPIHLYRINLDNSADAQKVTPFPGTVNGYHLNKHLVDPVNNVVVVSDSINKVTAGYRYLGNGNLKQLWKKPLDSAVIAAASSSSGYLFITDDTVGSEYLAIVDINTGRTINKIKTGSPGPTQGALGFGFNKDVFYTGPGRITTRIYNP